MLLDAVTTKALATLIIISTQGGAILEPRLPLSIEDQGDTWLVKSTPYEQERLGLQHCMFYAFIRKDTAEVTGMDFVVRRILTAEQKSYWSKLMAPEQYASVFGPPRHFEQNGIRDIYFVAYGGLINKPADAVDYAYELMQTKPGLAMVHKADLKAEEVDTAKDKVWHVIQHYPDGTDVEVLSFSRKTGKLLSGDI